MSGAPSQVGWFYPRPLRAAVGRLAPEHDLVLCVTARACDPSLDSPYVVDHIDALSLNASNRGAARRRGLMRAAWSVEARRMARFERAAAANARAQLVCSPVDAGYLPSTPPPVVIPPPLEMNGGPHPVGASRDIDVIFTGNMRYPPNARAAAVLTRDIAPLVGARREAKIMLVGRDAMTVPEGRYVERVADVPSIAPYLHRSKILVAPIRGGTGVPSKVLDAALAGAAVVLSDEANSSLGFSAGAVAVASTPGEFADRILRLLDDDDLRRSSAELLQRELQRFDIVHFAREYDGVLARAAGSHAG
jgi:glycosyltransferase involved in cell wall biosynthesis